MTKTLRFNFLALAIAAYLGWMAFFFGSMKWEFYRTSRVAQGEVVSLTSRFKGEAVFVVNNGNRDVTYTLLVSRLTPELAVGERVEIRYDPKSPDAQPKLDSFFTLWGSECFLLFVTLVFLHAGLKGKSLRRGR